MKLSRRRVLFLASTVAVVTVLALSLRPDRIVVETATARRGPLQTTVDEEGRTRVRHRYLVAAPVDGHLCRITLDEGDSVPRGTPLVQISPTPLDPRTASQARARLEATEAAEREAAAGVALARAARREATSKLARAESLAVDGFISQQELELAQLNAETAQRRLEAAAFRSDAAASEVDVARAALLASTPAGDAPPAGECLVVPSPIDGRVLRVYEENARVVAAGTPLLEVGDPADLEIVVDLLSTDAVRVAPGATMLIEEWGGDTTLRARVRMVEPSGFTKVSALGVEEQRVNVIADFVDPPGALGDGYRVETRTILRETDDALIVPWSALFRRGDDWGAFAVEDGRARRRDVQAGHRGAVHVEILAGLTEGDTVILHPSDRIDEGVRVRPR